MQEQHSFEYAVIRVVPKVEREEFMNVGVILYCQSLSFLDALFSLNEERLFALSPGLEMDEIKKHLSAFCNICKGGPEAGPIGKLDMGSRFRWLTATRSTVLQCSKVHPGLSSDPELTLKNLHKRLVLGE
ncbi:MAG TPA: DUF3037 domain-containing protein [Puia sp.]|jgi:hypothetical protein|nr:DUF3037 domain-containing protein [Puia sp.]